LYLLERFNGKGYINRNMPSPYLWSGTNQYVKGKYIADGVFSADAVSKQVGCATLMKYLKVT
jgi:lysozyme family protein